MTTKSDVDINDVIVVVVVAIIRHQKKVFCELRDTTEVDDWTTVPTFLSILLFVRKMIFEILLF